MNAPTLTEPLRYLLLTVLSLALFALDTSLPLGIATGVLYAGVVLLTTGTANVRVPLIVSGIASILIVGGAIGTLSPHVPLWVGVINRTLSLTVVWAAWAFVRHRQEAERALLDAQELLERRVRQRTEDLARANESLMAEITQHRATEQSLRASEAALEASRQDLRGLTARLLAAQEDERRRLARDLHDDINQRLAMLVVELEALDREYPTVPAALGSRLRSLQDNAGELSEDVRRLAYQHHPSVLDDLGLVVALRRLTDDVAQRSGLAITFTPERVPEGLDRAIATGCYRITQECLTNVVRHARATAVTVAVQGEPDALTLSISDNGVGFAPRPADGSESAARGLGMVSMEERANVLGGTLRVRSEPGRGTTVHLRIPRQGTS